MGIEVRFDHIYNFISFRFCARFNAILLSELLVSIWTVTPSDHMTIWPTNWFSAPAHLEFVYKFGCLGGVVSGLRGSFCGRFELCSDCPESMPVTKLYAGMGKLLINKNRIS